MIIYAAYNVSLQLLSNLLLSIIIIINIIIIVNYCQIPDMVSFLFELYN